MPVLTRRTLTAALLAAGASPALAAPKGVPDPTRRAAQRLAALDGNGGNLMVFAHDTGSGRTLAHRADERALMCSTFKVFAAGAVLQRVDQGRLRLDRKLPFTKKDLVEYAPFSEAKVAQGFMTLGEATQAIVTVSDNTAANLVNQVLGGPQALRAFVAQLGDTVTRFDRSEPELNDRRGELDTTTARAFAGSLRNLLLGNTLTPASRRRIEGWMQAATTGPKRLKAGMPRGWVIGHKTGSGPDQTNDEAIIRPPGRAPVILTTFYNDPPKPVRHPEAILAEVARVVVDWLG